MEEKEKCSICEEICLEKLFINEEVCYKCAKEPYENIIINGSCQKELSKLSDEYVDLTVTQIVGVDTSDINNIVPDYSNAAVLNKGMTVQLMGKKLFKKLDGLVFVCGVDCGLNGVVVDAIDADPGAGNHQCRAAAYSRLIQGRTVAAVVGDPRDRILDGPVLRTVFSLEFTTYGLSQFY